MHLLAPHDYKYLFWLLTSKIGDQVEGGDVWVECWAVIRGVQKPALRETAEDQQQIMWLLPFGRLALKLFCL